MSQVSLRCCLGLLVILEVEASQVLSIESDECFDGSCALNVLQLSAGYRKGDRSLELKSFGEAPTEDLLWAKYQVFLLEYGRQYGVEEQHDRFVNFKKSFRRAQALSGAGDRGEAFGINSFSDFYPEELPRRGLQTDLAMPLDSLGSSAKELNVTDFELPKNPEPLAINWRLTRAVSPVKNQGSCGACWAFVTAEEVESMYTLWQDGGPPGYSQIFSVQQMISCSDTADGCGGGNPVDGYTYLLKNKIGLVQESYWPYEGGYLPSDRCDYKYCTKPCDKNLTDAATFQHIIGPIGKVMGGLWATPLCTPGTACESQNLESLRRVLVQLGPIAVAVNSQHWLLYAGGVLTYDACGGSGWNDLDHAAQLTGYNASVTSASLPYWIVRNQWSTTWGENGYIYLEFFKNTCGIANMATLPLMAGMPRSKDSEEIVMLETPKQNTPFGRMYQEALGNTDP